MELKFILILFFSLNLAVGDVTVRIDDLGVQVERMRDEISELSKMLYDLEHSVVNRNIADQKLDKVIANVLLNNQKKAMGYWKEVVAHVDASLQNEYLSTLVENAYLGNSDNFYYVLDFLIRNELYVGFLMLYKELEEHRELHSGQEIFALANAIKVNCGSSSRFYNELPKVVQNIMAGPVIIKSLDSKGYAVANENSFPCEEKSICYQNRKAQVFVDLFPSNASMENIKNNTRTHWQFLAADNITELSSGFYIKSMDKDLFLVFSQKPHLAFLKGNTTLESYYSPEMHLQFFPTLVPNSTRDDSLLRIGVRDKFSRKMSYFFSGDFVKRNTRVNLSRRPMFDELKGFVWEVIPVNGDHTIDNVIEGRATNEQCDL